MFQVQSCIMVCNSFSNNIFMGKQYFQEKKKYFYYFFEDFLEYILLINTLFPQLFPDTPLPHPVSKFPFSLSPHPVQSVLASSYLWCGAWPGVQLIKEVTPLNKTESSLPLCCYIPISPLVRVELCVFLHPTLEFCLI